MWAFALLVTLLLGADAARAGTSLFLRGEFGREVVHSPSADWQINGSYGDGWLSVEADCFPPACSTFEEWRFGFGAPVGEPLVAGVYEGARGSASLDWPALAVSRYPPSGFDCTTFAGRFEIRELIPVPTATSFFSASVDFEVHCGDEVLVGAVHLFSGDRACASGGPGTICDDLDVCTSSDACEAGECAGIRDAACDPVTCDDGDPCTDDRREGTACTHTAIAGSCWRIDEATVRAASSASAGGRSATCSLRCRGAPGGSFALLDDGTYVTPGSHQTEGCVVGTTIPTEVGHIRTGRRGALILTPDNLSEQEEALIRCIGRPLVVKDMRTRLRIAEDGTSLSGVSKLRFRVPGPVPVEAQQALRFRATRRSVETAAAGARRRALPACSPDLRPKCVTH